MSRPLAWVIALILAGIVGLSVLVSRGGPDVATPEPDSATAAAVRAPDAANIIAANSPRAVVPPERQAIVSETNEPTLTVGSIAAPETEPRDGIVEGRVVGEEDGLPIPGAEVVLDGSANGFEQIRRRVQFGEPERTIAGHDGTFRFSGLQHGAWSVTASAIDRESRRERVVADGWPPKASVTLKLRLQRTVRVRLIDSSGRIATAESLGVESWMADMLCIGVASACSRPGTTFQNDGAFQYNARSTGGRALDWNVEIRGGGAACLHVLRGDRVLSSRPFLLGEREVEIQVSAQDLARDLVRCDVRVVDEIHGDPVEGAAVRVRPHLGQPRNASSDAEGRASIDRLPAGAVTIDVTAPGFAALRQATDLPLGAPVLLRLSRGRRVEGVLLDLTGMPIENVRVSIATQADFDQLLLGQSPRTVPTGRGGQFAFDGLSLETYVVSAPAGLASIDEFFEPRSKKVGAAPFAPPEPTRTVDVRAGDVLDVVLRVTRDAF